MNHLIIDENKCIGCGRCTKACLKDNIEVINKKAVEKGTDCMECSHCISVCPKGAIQLKSNGVKSSKWFDGRPISDEELNKLFDAAYYTPTGKLSDCVEIVVIGGKRLDAFMELIWEILKDKVASMPIMCEWEKWRQHHELLEPNPVLWEGQQIMLMFSMNPEDALISSTKMERKGMFMGICGFYSVVIMQAAKESPEKITEFFSEASQDKRLQCAFVIGHGRRIIEPIFAPLKKLKGFLK